MKIRITILCDNLVGRRVGAGEHGFSVFIESEEGNYLFDTGSGHSVVENSMVLNRDSKKHQKNIPEPRP